jgi:hypothetical protein
MSFLRNSEASWGDILVIIENGELQSPVGTKYYSPRQFEMNGKRMPAIVALQPAWYGTLQSH